MEYVKHSDMSAGRCNTNRNQTFGKYTFLFRDHHPEDSRLYYNTRYNVSDERLTFVLRVKKRLVSNLGTETGYTYRGLSWFPQPS